MDLVPLACKDVPIDATSCLWGFYVWSLFCYAVLSDLSSFAIIMPRKRELFSLLKLSC